MPQWNKRTCVPQWNKRATVEQAYNAVYINIFFLATLALFLLASLVHTCEKGNVVI